MPSRLFVHKVLLSLQFLQGLSRRNLGATGRRITSYITKNFPNDGDIASQVQASLDECVHYGFVEKQKNKYILVGPIASIQMQPHNSQYRENEVKRIRKIFPYDWRYSRKRLRHDKYEPKPGTFASLINTVKNWLFGTPRSHYPARKEFYNSRLTSIKNLRRMRRRRRCSRSGCRKPHESNSDASSRKNKYRKDADRDSVICANLKKRRQKLRDEASKIIAKYKSRCELKKRERKKSENRKDRDKHSRSVSDENSSKDSYVCYNLR